MKKGLLLVLFIALIKLIQAQGPSLGIVPQTLVIQPDTVHFYDTVSISFYVTNTGDSTYFGAIGFEYQVNNGYSFPLDTVNTLFQLGPGMAQLVTDSNHVISPFNYAVGDNIVVIWPVALAGNVATTDSAMAHVWVDTFSGIGAPDMLNKILVTANYSEHLIHINYQNAVDQISGVDCYSMDGKQLMHYRYPVNEVSLADIPQSVLLLVIRSRDGESVSFKILRM